jgi:hypothetical protein
VRFRRGNRDFSAWLSPKAPDTSAIGTADPWGGAPQSNADLVVGDWADFSSVTFEANFDSAFDKKPSESDVSRTVENDLKVESIEIEDAKTPNPKDDNCKVSIENVAQAPNKDADEKKEREAGDLCAESKDDSQKQTQPVTEPSNAPSLVEGDSCSMKSQEVAPPEKKDV